MRTKRSNPAFLPQRRKLGCFVASLVAMTGERHALSFPRLVFARGVPIRCPSLTEGAGKAGRRLRPQAPCARGSKEAHGFDRYSRDIPAFPAQWLYGLFVLSPVSGLYCHRCRPAQAGRIDARVAAPGPHDFAVRCSVFVRREARLTRQRPSQPAPRFVTIAQRPFWRRGLRRNIVLIYVIVKRYFEIRN